MSEATGRSRGDAGGHAPAGGPDVDLAEALRALAVRVEAARRLTPPAGAAILRSVVETTATLFGAEAASIALYDATVDRLVFEVAAGEQGQGVVGVSIEPTEGVAGYVFSTGQAIALSDVAADARFGRATAERTGYVPRSLIALPLADDDGVIGVLEVLDKRGDGGFDLRDMELAGAFARQATVAIRSGRLERDTASLLRSVIGAAGGPGGEVDAVVDAAIDGLDADPDDPVWALADQIARLRAADPAQLDLVRELLAVVVSRADRSGRGGRGRPVRGEPVKR